MFTTTGHLRRPQFDLREHPMYQLAPVPESEVHTGTTPFQVYAGSLFSESRLRRAGGQGIGGDRHPCHAWLYVWPCLRHSRIEHVSRCGNSRSRWRQQWYANHRRVARWAVPVRAIQTFLTTRPVGHLRPTLWQDQRDVAFTLGYCPDRWRNSAQEMAIEMVWSRGCLDKHNHGVAGILKTLGYSSDSVSPHS